MDAEKIKKQESIYRQSALTFSVSSKLTGIIVSSLMIFSLMAGNINAQNIELTRSDIAMARDVIQKNTRSISGFTPGSRTNVSSGNFSPADALVLYMLKFHHQIKICPPLAVLSEALKKLNDTELSKKSAAIFWKDYSTCSDLNQHISKPGALASDFEWYILTKQTERLKISNARLQGYIGADEAWRKAMSSQQNQWQKSRSREDEFILTRDAYRATLSAEAAVAAAERAVRSGY